MFRVFYCPARFHVFIRQSRGHQFVNAILTTAILAISFALLSPTMRTAQKSSKRYWCDYTTCHIHHSSMWRIHRYRYRDFTNEFRNLRGFRVISLGSKVSRHAIGVAVKRSSSSSSLIVAFDQRRSHFLRDHFLRYSSQQTYNNFLSIRDLFRCLGGNFLAVNG